VRGHGHHHVVSREASLPRRYHEPVSVSRQPVHPDACSHRELEPCGVRLEVVGNLVLRWECLGHPREGHPGQPAVAAGSEQAEGVPSVPPGVADAVVSIEDHERELTLRQVVSDREAGLAAADNDGSVALEQGFPP
jgi:hypothetical protein